MDSGDDNMRDSPPRRLDSFRLVPVIEFEPGRFSDRVSPIASGLEDPAAWQAWWKSCLADAGLVGVEPIAPGSWFVAVETVDDPKALTTLLEAHLDTFERKSLQKVRRAVARTQADAIGAVREYVAPFAGGCALVADRETLLAPGCCSDLGDLAEWEAAVRGGDTEWAGLWTGHPFPNARVVEGRLQLTHAEDTPSTSAMWSLDRARVVDELARARTSLDAFADRLRGPVIDLLGASHEVARAIAKHLVGIE